MENTEKRYENQPIFIISVVLFHVRTQIRVMRLGNIIFIDPNDVVNFAFGTEKVDLCNFTLGDEFNIYD